MTLKVYGPPLFTSTARVLGTLYEKNVEDFEIIPIDVTKGEHKTPEYMKLQPFGIVPVLQDGDLTLFESRAMARYIAHKYEGQGTALYGKTLKDKALVEQWLEVEGQNFHEPVHDIVYEVYIGPTAYGKPTNEEVVATQLAKLGTVLDVYQKQLSKTKYLAGDFFSLADLSHLPFLDFLIIAAKRGDVLESRPAVRAWWEDISGRPAWKKWQALKNP